MMFLVFPVDCEVTQQLRCGARPCEFTMPFLCFICVFELNSVKLKVAQPDKDSAFILKKINSANTQYLRKYTELEFDLY